jgi:hypothetical protein
MRERRSEMAARRAFVRVKSRNVFVHPKERAKRRSVLWARVSTHDEQAVPIHSHAVRESASRRRAHRYADPRSRFRCGAVAESGVLRSEMRSA